jgi:signal transduction histidine kinase
MKVNLSEIIKSNIEILSGSALKKEITIISKIEDGLYISGDNDMLNSIIINLLTNAIKFTNRNGKIIIRAKQKDDSIILEIEDNGIGMDENTIQNIFGFNPQKSMVGTENESGTGLGLLLVKEFVEKLNGSIYVNSELNKGSLFTLILPLFNENSKQIE